MSRTAYAPSLLDDLSFVAELERLDSDLPPLRDMWGGVRGGTEPAVSEADDQSGALDDFDDFDHRGAATLGDDDVPHTGSLAAGRMIRAARTILAVGGFLMMMLVGAAAAAAVFHDHVARILR